jgi:hypothetical protein
MAVATTIGTVFGTRQNAILRTTSNPYAGCRVTRDRSQAHRCTSVRQAFLQYGRRGRESPQNVIVAEIVREVRPHLALIHYHLLRRYIGGTTPSAPTTTRCEVNLLSAPNSEGANTAAPVFRSSAFPTANATMGVLSGIAIFF